MAIMLHYRVKPCVFIGNSTCQKSYHKQALYGLFFHYVKVSKTNSLSVTKGKNSSIQPA